MNASRAAAAPCVVVLVVGLIACAVACGPARAPAERSLPRRTTASAHARDGGVRPFGEFTVGGAGDPTIPFLGDAGARVMVSADAGVASAEAAWLVAHIDDGPDRLHPLDSGSVRALSARGADGVRGIVPVLRAGDAARAPFARRVIERLLVRSCGRLGHARALELGAWIERGYEPDRPMQEGEVFVWTRRDDDPWPPTAIARLLAWADGGLQCTLPAPPPTASARTPDASAPRGDARAAVPAAASTDASATGFDATITLP